MAKTTKGKRLMTVLHAHRHGVTSYLIRASKIPTEKQLVKKLEIDFKPDRDEFIEVQDDVGCPEVIEFP